MISLGNMIIYHDIDKVRAFLDQSPDTDLQAYDEYGFTPLIESAIMGKASIAHLLIERGADVNAKDLTGGTALHWAIENSNLPLCESLLKNGADPNAFNSACQPVLMNPLLREQEELKMLLYMYGAKLSFAQDYINTKMIAHRFELNSQIDIVNANNKFISLSLEGFFLEFSVNTLSLDLMRYLNNFAARSHRRMFVELQQTAQALRDAAELCKWQQYQMDITQPDIKRRIHGILDSPLNILPVNFEGHAISLVTYGDRMIICDRRMASTFTETLPIYRIGNTKALSKRLIKTLIYQKKSRAMIEEELPKLLKLKPIGHLIMPKQISGNCSWANIEAAVPAALALLLEEPHKHSSLVTHTHPAMVFFNQWHEWGKDQALNQCIESFFSSNQCRQISKASLLACVLFQRCGLTIQHDLPRIKKILTILKRPELRHILEHYIKIYHTINRTKAGKHLLDLIEDYEDTH